jgi:pimeloyl-ACP methyl ester carboxylesterase
VGESLSGGSRPWASLAGVCLDRTVELDNVRLRVRDWPGVGGCIVHVSDPLAASSVIDRLAARFTPRFRVMSVSPRGASPYQVDAVDLIGVLDQFGFEAPALISERLGCLTALLVAAWYPERVGCLVLVDMTLETSGLMAQALRDCPPDLARLRATVRCPVLESTDLADIETFVRGTLP